MGPSITNNGRVLPTVLYSPEGSGVFATAPASPGAELGASLVDEKDRSAVASAFADVSAPAHTVLALCDDAAYLEQLGEHVGFPRQMPKRWLDNSVLTKQTVTTAKTLGWSAVKLSEMYFLLPPSGVLSDILSAQEYKLLSDAGVASQVFAQGGRGPSNLDLLESELLNVAPSETNGIFHPDNYLLRSLDEAFEDGYLLVNLNETNFLIREEFLSQDAKWTLLRLKTAGVAHVRGALALDGDNKTATLKKGQHIAMDDVIPLSSGGELDLAELQLRQWDRWTSDPQPVVDLLEYKLPARLRDWLKVNIKYVEPQDLERLEHFISGSKRAETVEQIDANMAGVKGKLTEIAVRSRIHAEYLDIQKMHKNAIMLVAPQIYDGNILEASDAIIGEIVVGGSLRIYSVWEITALKGGFKSSRAQMDDTIKRRFAKRGIQIRDGLNRGATLNVEFGESAEKNVIVFSDDGIAKMVGVVREQMLTKFEEEYLVPKPLEIRSSSTSRYSTATLIAKLQLFAEKLHHVPTVKELKVASDMPSESVYSKRFGNYNGAIRAAGLEPNLESFTKEKLIRMLKNFAEKLGHTPTKLEVKAARDMPSSTTYSNHFGTFEEALKAAGFEPNTERYTKEELIVRLVAFGKKLGRTPTKADIGSDESMPSYDTFKVQFGGIGNALKSAGFAPNREYYTRDDLIRKLQEHAKRLGRTPKLPEVIADPSMPCYPTLHAHFGTFQAALDAAGLKK